MLPGGRRDYSPKEERNDHVWDYCVHVNTEAVRGHRGIGDVGRDRKHGPRSGP